MTVQLTQWRLRAACRGAPHEFFIPIEGQNEEIYPPTQALQYCNVCPVQSECLTEALAQNEVGVWGGTSTFQRKKMKRIRARTHCPNCESNNLVENQNVELCLACGVSWRIKK